jgi:hypothetical protein
MGMPQPLNLFTNISTEVVPVVAEALLVTMPVTLP